MSNEFGKFYSTLGKNVAAQIKPDNTGIDEYLAKIKRVDAGLVLNPITLTEVEKIINLPNKTSHEHDSITNVLLKKLCTCISFPLCIIFNLSLAQGEFPDAMKKQR